MKNRIEENLIQDTTESENAVKRQQMEVVNDFPFSLRISTEIETNWLSSNSKLKKIRDQMYGN